MSKYPKFDIYISDVIDSTLFYSEDKNFFLTPFSAAVIHNSLAFNVGITNANVLSGEKKDFFGYKLLQFTSAEKTRYVSICCYCENFQKVFLMTALGLTR